MRRRSAAVLVLAILPLASCATPKEKERTVVGPQSEESKIPWNTPVSGQGGGILSAMPKTPRR